MSELYTNEELGERKAVYHRIQKASQEFSARIQLINSRGTDHEVVANCEALYDSIVKVYARTRDHVAHVRDAIDNIVNFIGVCDCSLICDEMLITPLTDIFEILLMLTITIYAHRYRGYGVDTDHVWVISLDNIVVLNCKYRVIITDTGKENMRNIRDALGILIDNIITEIVTKKEQLYERIYIVHDIATSNVHNMYVLAAAAKRMIRDIYHAIHEWRYSLRTMHIKMNNPVISELHISMIPVDCDIRVFNAVNIARLDVLCGWAAFNTQRASYFHDGVSMTPYVYDDEEITVSKMYFEFDESDMTVIVTLHDLIGFSTSEAADIGHEYTRIANLFYATAVNVYDRACSDIIAAVRVIHDNLCEMSKATTGVEDDQAITYLREDISSLTLRNSLLIKMHDKVTMILDHFARTNEYYESHPLIPTDTREMIEDMLSVTDDGPSPDLRELAVMMACKMQDHVL